MNLNRAFLLFSVSLCLLLTVVANRSRADSMLAANIQSVHGTHSLAGSYEVRGYQFRTSNTSYVVHYVGLYDWFETGYSNSHAIGIWRTTGQMLGSATIRAGIESPLYKGFRWAKLSSPIHLDTHSSFVIAATHSPWTNDAVRRKVVDIEDVITGEGLYLEPYIRFTVSSQPIGLTFPTWLSTNSQLRFGPNLAGTIVPFDEYDDSEELQPAQITIDEGVLSILLPSPAPFKRHAVSHSTDLIENEWVEVGLIPWREEQPELGSYIFGVPDTMGFFRVEQEDFD